MDERDKQRDSREVEQAFGRYANRLANIERTLEYLSSTKTANGNGKNTDYRYLTVSNVLSIVVAVLLAIVGYMVSGFQNEVKTDIKFLRDEIYMGRERDLNGANDRGRIHGVLDALQKEHDALEKEVREIREKGIKRGG